MIQHWQQRSVRLLLWAMHVTAWHLKWPLCSRTMLS